MGESNTIVCEDLCKQQRSRFDSHLAQNLTIFRTNCTDGEACQLSNLCRDWLRFGAVPGHTGRRRSLESKVSHVTEATNRLLVV